MKHIDKIVIIILIWFLPACTDKFEEINDNPNFPQEVGPDLILTNILNETASIVTFEAVRRTNGLAQYTTRFFWNNIERYDFESQINYWKQLYEIIRDIKNLQGFAEAANNDGYIGIALIMKSYVASQLTDLWGDVPYFQAATAKTEENFTPVYNAQEEIYMAPGGILDNLRQANTILSNNNNTISGDIFYQGDLNKWRKFANSLRLRYLLRISSKVDVSTEMQQIIDAEPVFESNDDNALLPYLADAPNQFPLHTFREGDVAFFRLSDTMEGILKQFNDPRLSLFFEPTEDSRKNGSPAYFGMPVGLLSETQSDLNIVLTNISRLGKYFTEPDQADAIIMTFADLQFILAEATYKNLIGGDEGDVQMFYEAGIKSTFSYYGLTLPAGYLTQPGVSFEVSNALEQILTQRWLANITVAQEGWIEFRRTGLPALPLPIDNTNSLEVPSRFLYPEEEQLLNPEHLQQAVESMGGTDDINAAVWWER
ncbi:SusD/RagB family nutrient-binding outer membrane lipoprotein [Fulvivirgaceae bacterium BMA12]|uniref:SusD/RagB family nutrient-binding outer membrane lipoprotein n=1 Tax=Agaribacillus aureus TaxID=3051825 RepID=A0ABT8L159_9BACT|nr:SusD/RagB family nutrient-binding outer membrane lipoprotein [Fulvivirgaceae bacterium BMA12]